MKILFVENIANVSYNIAKRLRRMGYDVILVTRYNPGAGQLDLASISDEPWVKLFRCESLIDKTIRYLLKIVSYKVDIIHYHYALEQGLYAIISRELGRAKKVICHCHGTDLRDISRIDVETFVPLGNKKMYVLTVGAVNRSNLKKKGLESFVKTAKFLPNTRFILVGRHVDDSINYLKKIASENVEFTGYIPFSRLLELYGKAAVYAQLSYHESFGVALAEAMACGCVPVVTRKAALPEVVGKCGIYVPYGDAETTAKAIQEAFRRKELGKCARDRICRMFSLEKREEKLIEALNSLYIEKPRVKNNAIQKIYIFISIPIFRKGFACVSSNPFRWD